MACTSEAAEALAAVVQCDADTATADVSCATAEAKLLAWMECEMNEMMSLTKAASYAALNEAQRVAMVRGKAIDVMEKMVQQVMDTRTAAQLVHCRTPYQIATDVWQRTQTPSTAAKMLFVSVKLILGRRCQCSG